MDEKTKAAVFKNCIIAKPVYHRSGGIHSMPLPVLSEGLLDGPAFSPSADVIGRHRGEQYIYKTGTGRRAEKVYGRIIRGGEHLMRTNEDKLADPEKGEVGFMFPNGSSSVGIYYVIKAVTEKEALEFIAAINSRKH